MTRVLFKPATRRDGEAAGEALARVGIDLVVLDDYAELLQALPDRVGALLLTDLALLEPGFEDLLTMLERQPAWSDLAVILMVKEDSPGLAAVVARLTNVTLLDRPSSIRTLVSALQAALRARQRQYQMRDQLVELEQAHTALREADQRKDRFIATLAHELRNPLAPIRVSANLLARPDLTPEQLAESAAMIARQTTHMALLLDDLLDVARVTSGKLALRQSEVPLGSVVDSAVEAVRPLIDEKQHQLNVRVDEPERPLFCDALRISQVLTNVLANAAKYTDAGGRIELRAQALTAEGCVEFTVRDNGVGIAADLLPRLFTMFVQADAAHGRSGGGLGIGLALSRSLVELHGGSLTAESDGIGRGSVFSIRLPDRAAETAAVATEAVPLPASAPASSAARPAAAEPAPTAPRVLVVDDNEDAASAMALLLQLHGYDAIELFSGARALEAGAQQRPAAMLVDIGMADMDGYEVARRVRQQPWGAGVLLVACTGWGQPEDRRLALAAGFDAHLTKPVSPEDLTSLLQQGLHPAAAMPG